MPQLTKHDNKEFLRGCDWHLFLNSYSFEINAVGSFASALTLADSGCGPLAFFFLRY